MTRAIISLETHPSGYGWMIVVTDSEGMTIRQPEEQPLDQNAAMTTMQHLKTQFPNAVFE